MILWVTKIFYQFWQNMIDEWQKYFTRFWKLCLMSDKSIFTRFGKHDRLVTKIFYQVWQTLIDEWQNYFTIRLRYPVGQIAGPNCTKFGKPWLMSDKNILPGLANRDWRVTIGRRKMARWRRQLLSKRPEKFVNNNYALQERQTIWFLWLCKVLVLYSQRFIDFCKFHIEIYYSF